MVLFRHLRGETEQNHETLSQDSRSPSLYLNKGLREYEAEVETAQP
jgi:hypothetical protein